MILTGSSFPGNQGRHTLDSVRTNVGTAQQLSTWRIIGPHQCTHGVSIVNCAYATGAMAARRERGRMDFMVRWVLRYVPELSKRAPALDLLYTVTNVYLPKSAFS